MLNLEPCDDALSLLDAFDMDSLRSLVRGISWFMSRLITLSIVLTVASSLPACFAAAPPLMKRKPMMYLRL